MSDPTSGPPARLRPLAEALDPRVRRLWRIEIGLATVVAVAAGAGLLAVVRATAGPPTAWLVAALAAVALLGAGAAAAVPPLAHRAIRFEVTPLGLAVQTGWIVRTVTIVPHSRIQSVRTASDPLQRALGLATVEVHTAAAVVARVPGLDAARVAALRADLAAMAGAGQAT